MSKRKLNLRQHQRIKKIQSQWLEAEQPESASQTGLVICSYGTRAELETQTGERIDCMVRPNLPQLVAGDKVIWQPSHGAGIILSCHPRETVLERLDYHGIPKPLAANLTQLIIVMAAEPAISWTLLDSYLVTAEQLNLQVCLVLNKIDLPIQTSLETLNTYYVPLGYPLLCTTKQDLKSYHHLEAQLRDQVSIFIGQSGVGKSSIIDTLLPLVSDIQTAPISEASGLGKHTTSHTRYYHLPQGGAILDSPGVRAFNPPFVGTAQLVYGYREFQPLFGTCKFRNCDHMQTKGCAIIEAVKNGKISEFRYQNFVRLLLTWRK